MPKEYKIYVTKNKEARERFISGEYAEAIKLYNEALQALTIDIENIAGKDKARCLYEMNEECNVRENIVRCYRQLGLMRGTLKPGAFLSYGNCILAYISSARNFLSRLELTKIESLSPKSATDIESDTSDRKEFLESGEIAEWLCEFVRCNMHDVVSDKRQTIEDLQIYVSEIIPNMARAKEKFDEIVHALIPIPVVIPKGIPFISQEYTKGLAEIFTREESLVCEDIADQLIDFYHGNKQSLGKQVRKTLLKTAYECYKKYKDYIDSIKDSYEDDAVYVRDSLEIIGSLSTTVDQFVQFNDDLRENVEVLIETEKCLDAFKTSKYDRLSVEQKLSFHNYQCCVRCRTLSIKRQRADYNPSNRIFLIFTNILSFSDKIRGRDSQHFHVETTEMMGCYDGIVREFLLTRISAKSCDQQIATRIIDHMVEYLTSKRFALEFQEEDLFALGRSGICAKWLMQDRSPYAQRPHEALVGFIKQLLSQKKPATLVAISDIFTDTSHFLASCEGYGEIAKIFADFVTYFPGQRVYAPPVAQTSIVAGVLPVAIDHGRMEAFTFQAIPKIAATASFLDLPKKKIKSYSHDDEQQDALRVQTVVGGFFPMFTFQATHVRENKTLPPKKRSCLRKEEGHITQQLFQQQPIGIVAKVESTTDRMIVDEPVAIPRMISGTPPILSLY